MSVVVAQIALASGIMDTPLSSFVVVFETTHMPISAVGARINCCYIEIIGSIYPGGVNSVVDHLQVILCHSYAQNWLIFNT